MRKIFGTDGIRGLVNGDIMNSDFALAVGRAVASNLINEKANNNVIIGRDTRISGDMLEAALVSGITSMGVNAVCVGIISTPGVSYLVQHYKAGAGIMLSASHNPFYDNGIKIFNKKGYKLTDAEEELMETLFSKNFSLCKGITKTGKYIQKPDAYLEYIDFIEKIIDKNKVEGLKIVIDCSNGSFFKIGPEVFENFGADTTTLFAEPDGININEKCGSQYPELLSEKVKEKNADIGFAFDGDGDRLIVVDEKGNIVNGDQIIAICAKNYIKKKRLKNNTIVTSLISNSGLKIALKKMGIKHVTADVGDRYVFLKMLETKAALGGEDSGHIIFADHLNTGDGLISALMVINTIVEEEKPLSELTKIVNIFPQILINVDVSKRPNIEDVPEIVNIIKDVEKKLKKEGRVLVRYSGTQPKCRVTVEGKSEAKIKELAQSIADVVKEKLG
jgi:phosphoglucosamine mutase